MGLSIINWINNINRSNLDITGFLVPPMIIIPTFRIPTLHFKNITKHSQSHSFLRDIHHPIFRPSKMYTCLNIFESIVFSMTIACVDDSTVLPSAKVMYGNVVSSNMFQNGATTGVRIFLVTAELRRYQVYYSFRLNGSNFRRSIF